MAYKTNVIYWPFLFIIDLLGYLLFLWKKFAIIPENPENILVIKVDHIGDMILASSFFRNLKKNYPKSRIHVLCRSLTKDVAECIDYIDEVHVVNVPWFSRGETDKEKTKIWIKDHRKVFDLVFELHTDPRNIILASKVGKYVVGYGVRGFGFLLNKAVKWNNIDEHIVNRNLDLLSGIGKHVDNGHLELKVDDRYFSSAKKKTKISGKFIICHPISGRTEKNREWGFWNELNSKLRKKFKGASIVYGGAPQDRVIIDREIEPGFVNVAGELTLKEYLALLKHAELVVSPDTFAVHARAAFNKKLWVVTYPKYEKWQWGPYGTDEDKLNFL